MADEKLSPERAIRLLRAKGAELENLMPIIDAGEIRWLAADIALIAQLLADHIERSIKVEEAVVALNLAWGKLENQRQPWGPDHPDYDEMGQ